MGRLRIAMIAWVGIVCAHATLSSPEPTVVKELKPTRLYVQAGAFSFLENAERLRARLSDLADASVTPAQVDGRDLYRVRVGPIASLEQADATLEKLMNNGHIDARIIVD